MTSMNREEMITKLKENPRVDNARASKLADISISARAGFNPFHWGVEER